MTAPPSTGTFDRQDVTTALLVRTGSWTVLVTGTLIAALLLLDQPIVWPRVLLNFGAGLIGAVALLLGRSGRWHQAGLLLIWGVWAVVVMVAAMTGGLRGPSLLNFPVLIVLSGWVLGTRPTLALTGATGGVFLLFVWFDLQGWLPPPRYGTRAAQVAYLSGVLAITAAATLLSRRSYVRRTREAVHTASSLAARDAELRKLLRAVEQSPESIAITDLDGKIEYVNAEFLARTGYTAEEVIGQSSSTVSSNGMALVQWMSLRDTLSRGENWAGEQVNRRKDGAEIVEAVVVAPIRQPDGVITHYVEIKQDVTERRRAAAEIHRLAHFDVLTSLPNRATLVERLAALRWRGTAGAQPLHALVLLDLDRFTIFNDARGSEMGDRLLSAVALRLSQIVPAQGLLVRVAADEFAFVLHDLGALPPQASRRALTFASELQALLLQPMRLEGYGGDAQLGASVGITLYPQNAADTPHEAMRRASTALHRAKQAGGGRAAFFEQGMAEAAEQRFLVERSLRQAIASDELRLFLQSQVDVQGRLTGAEVLVRWQHPRDGLLSPGAFIPIAEESDLIVSLGTWVLERACRLLALPAMRERRLRLSVNLSARQFRLAGFLPQLRSLLQASGADPTLLTLEVTEGLVIDDVDDAVAKIRELAALGVEFSLDDFGTGYSSLAYLKRLPIQELKIDRSFVHEAPTNADDGVLVEGILSVARHFGLRVVAEGVETREQADFLSQREPGIVYQGYLFGRPEPDGQWLARLASAPVPTGA